MTANLQPLDQKFSIVNPDGTPTTYFTRWAQQKQIDIGNAIPAPSGAAEGDILYYGAGAWTLLPAGTSGNFLKTSGAGTPPAWAEAIAVVPDASWGAGYWRTAAGADFQGLTIGDNATEGTITLAKDPTGAIPGFFEFDLPGFAGGGAFGDIDPATNRLIAGTYGIVTGYQFSQTPYVTTNKIYHEGNLSFGTGLAYNATTGVLTASGGGGTSHPWFWSPPLAASFATTVTEGTATNTSFTDDADIGLVLGAQPGANINCYAKMMAAPAYPFTLTAHIAVTEINVIQVGVVLRASTTGVRVTFGSDAATGAGGLGVVRNTGTATQTAVNLITSKCFPQTGGLWLRVVATSATNVVYEISGDGKNWVVFLANTANGQVPSLNQIGLIIDARGGAPGSPAFLACDYWNVA